MVGLNRVRRAGVPAPRSVAAVVATGLTGAVLLAACGDDGDDSDDPSGEARVEETDLSRWRDIPLRDLGFTLSLPPGWEDVVLDADGMAILDRADPEPAGFAASARQAAGTGAVFYAAGGDGESLPEQPVNDLKILAHADPDASRDAAALADLIDERVTAAEAEGAETVEVNEVDDVDYTASDLRFRTTFPVAGGDEGDDGEDIVVEVVERVALAPSGVVYSVIITGEDADLVDQLAADIFETLELY
jgi:hypothetical protein